MQINEVVMYHLGRADITAAAASCRYAMNVLNGPSGKIAT